jgi:hypothetical protein
MFTFFLSQLVNHQSYLWHIYYSWHCSANDQLRISIVEDHAPCSGRSLANFLFWRRSVTTLQYSAGAPCFVPLAEFQRFYAIGILNVNSWLNVVQRSVRAHHHSPLSYIYVVASGMFDLKAYHDNTIKTICDSTILCF